MTDASHEPGLDAQGPSSHVSNSASRPTVASLGVQVRLIPIDQDREKELARLIAACEILRDKCESLFCRIVELLNDDRCSAQDGPSSSRDP
jgi:hypothetical protein